MFASFYDFGTQIIRGANEGIAPLSDGLNIAIFLFGFLFLERLTFLLFFLIGAVAEFKIIVIIFVEFTLF